MTRPIIRCGGCNYIFEKDYGYSEHVCKSKMEQITDKLTELVGEKFIAEDILDTKYAIEHKEKMNKICKSFEEMSCFILNTINKENEQKTHTHVIFHDKILDYSEANDHPSIEYYKFMYMPDEQQKLDYVNFTMKRKNERYFTTREYVYVWG